MTETKKTATKTPEDGGDDAGQAEVQRRSDEAAEKGYIGVVPPQPPNEAWSLESGADSPTVTELREFPTDVDS